MSDIAKHWIDGEWFPFSILVKVVNGRVTYLQFQEDPYATAASFRKDRSWTVQTEADAEPFQV